ncbi:MAG: hypothetical protein AAFV51_11960, partial [Pseudomonadota bacterium]
RADGGQRLAPEAEGLDIEKIDAAFGVGRELRGGVALDGEENVVGEGAEVRIGRSRILNLPGVK